MHGFGVSKNIWMSKQGHIFGCSSGLYLLQSPASPFSPPRDITFGGTPPCSLFSDLFHDNFPPVKSDTARIYGYHYALYHGSLQHCAPCSSEPPHSPFALSLGIMQWQTLPSPVRERKKRKIISWLSGPQCIHLFFQHYYCEDDLPLPLNNQLVLI